MRPAGCLLLGPVLVPPTIPLAWLLLFHVTVIDP